GRVDRSAAEGVPDGADHVVEGAGEGGVRGHLMRVSASHVPGAARSVGCAPRPRGEPGAHGGTDGCRGEPMTTRWTTAVRGAGALLLAALVLAGCGALATEPEPLPTPTATVAPPVRADRHTPPRPGAPAGRPHPGAPPDRSGAGRAAGRPAPRHHGRTCRSCGPSRGCRRTGWRTGPRSR